MAPASWAAFTLCLPRQALGPSLMLPPDRPAALPGGTWRNLSRFGAAGLGGMHGAQGQADRAPQAAGVPEHSLGRGRPLVRWRLPPDVAQCLQHAGRVGHRRRPLLGTPTPSALFPMSPHSSSADGSWCSTRGWERLRPQVVIIEVSHQGGPPARAGSPTSSWHPLGLQQLCGVLSGVLLEIFMDFCTFVLCQN